MDLMIDKLQRGLDHLTNNGIITSIVYGPCGKKGIIFSVDVLTSRLQSFREPFAADSFEQAVDIALLECYIRGWMPEYKEALRLYVGTLIEEDDYGFDD